MPATAPVRLGKPTSNLFRSRAETDARGLDTSGLTHVIAVDPEVSRPRTSVSARERNRFEVGLPSRTGAVAGSAR